MEKTNEEADGKTYNYRSQLRSESCYDDGVWEKNWKNILPKAPEKPGEETGIWRLVDGASDWKDISDDLASIPTLRPRPRQWLLFCDDEQDHLNHFLSKQHNKKPVRSSLKLVRKAMMCDKEVQTEPTDEDEENQYMIPIEHFVYVL